MTRVLLTNPYGPYELKWGTAPSDLLNARLGRGHGAFDMSSYLPTYPLYLIAENLKVPTTVLDFPRWDDFVHEVRKGYDFIAIELKSIHVRRVAKMIGAIKEISPKTQIVIGGYGVSAMCMEFTVCENDCISDEDCPPVSSGTTSPQCRDPFGSNRCSLPCGEGLVCPDGMACVYISSGFFCAWPSPLLMYGCPGYCSELDGQCDSRRTGDCCEGLVCAPWDQCEQGTCLRLSWPCSEDTAPCCEGMACMDGYCT